ncbi:putative nuclease HARBI1 [Neodiprion virginianus]|uniref:putative nuclease HARBI1 n=1 Tax=Neodiprion virginianus TaxID=2961670 RepID=UPI001EE70CE2|nr:putative nuclease HARBI1 [Neodiprion virginianus]
MRLKDTEKYTNYLRMQPEQFDTLLQLVSPRITKSHVVREPITASTRLALTLRYLASGDSMVSLSYAFRIGKSTVTGIISDTCEVLWTTLKDKVLFQPSAHNWLNIAEQFKDTWNFPKCIGAIDGKHVNIEARPNSGSTYYNYKGNHSLMLMAMCDAIYWFTLVDIGAQGWKIFQRPILASTETIEGIIKASVCLHNWLKKDEDSTPAMKRTYCPPVFADSTSSTGHINDGQWRAEVPCAMGIAKLR